MGSRNDKDGRKAYGSLHQIEHTLPQHERNGYQHERSYQSSLLVDNDDPRKEPSPRRPIVLRTLLFLSFATVTLAAGVISWHNQHESKSIYYEDTSREEYEYIIAGGGPAGILTATKLANHLLTANSKKTPPKVLLLESGTDTQSAVYENLKKRDARQKAWKEERRLNKFDIPLMWSGVASDDEQRQEDGWSAHHWPIKQTLLARALGGCGLHNAMIYVRSLPNDFERWKSDQWTWDTVLPHYRNLERFVDTLWSPPEFWSGQSLANKPWRGLNGPMVTVPAGPAIDSVAPLFVESAVNSGVPLAEQGFNHPDPSKRVGVGYYEFNIRNGVRDSVAQAMLADGNSIPPNLVIRTGATVSRVITETYEKATRAVGVEYVIDHNPSQATLHGNMGEVILAAGAIMTPQLLVNSGIGDGGSVVDLPGVGKDLQDHPVVALTYILEPKLAGEAPSMFTLAARFQDYFLSTKHLRKAATGEIHTKTHETNAWASQLGTLGTAGFSSGAFLKSPWAEHESPDIQLTVFPRVVEPHVRRQQKLETNDPYLLKSKEMLVTVALLQPQGRYEVRTSKHSSDALYSTEIKPDTGSPTRGAVEFRLPLVELPENKTSYLTAMDVKRLSWGMEQVRRILSFAPLNNLTQGELHPGSSVTGKELDDYIRENHLTNSHWVGSTKMGSADDPFAVVGENLRVRGVRNLRIVDAGVIPHIPNGNTHSTVCVVASRAVEMIVADRNESVGQWI